MEFIPIIDYAGYEINRLGEVRNVLKGNILKQYLDTNGYLYVSFYIDKYPKNFSIHRLLGIHFIENSNNKPYIDHINRIKTDNRIENLRWADAYENNQNHSINKNNKLKEQYISMTKSNTFEFKRIINNIRYRKRFETLEEAIEYRNNFTLDNH